jgi:protein-S-isoprenylcysteine O-methyltransferase Ste14
MYSRYVKYLVLATAWSAYCALHSAMISPTVTRLVKRRLGERFRFYRLFFNAVAILTLIPLLRFSLSVQGEPVFRWEGALLPVRYALLACGVLLAITGARHYSLAQFSGIAQIRGTSAGGLATAGGLDSSGVLGVVRHPWYVAVALLIWARDLDIARLVANGVLTAYIVVGTLLEERKLVLEFGESYRQYQSRVSMFVPFKWLRSRLSGTHFFG